MISDMTVRLGGYLAHDHRLKLRRVNPFSDPQLLPLDVLPIGGLQAPHHSFINVSANRYRARRLRAISAASLSERSTFSTLKSGTVGDELHHRQCCS